MNTSEKRRNFKDAGRVCPVDYRIEPESFSKGVIEEAHTLYVVGGLYGNAFALDALDDLVASELNETRVVLNGDIHWFDKDPSDFRNIEQRVASYAPLAGNVEVELRRETDIGVGCGCSYPDCTSDADVSRSNRIHKILRAMISEHPDLKPMFNDRLSVATVMVGGVKIAITHGDEQLVGGWGCSRESLQDVIRQGELDDWLRLNQIEILATTHTCAPAAITLHSGVVINNGAAGIPNFRNQTFGLVTRIATTPSAHALYSARRGSLSIEAVPLRYDHESFVEWFDDQWTPLSPAAISYRERVVAGPLDSVENALLGGFEITSKVCSEDSEDSMQPNESVLAFEVDRTLASTMYFEDMLSEASLYTKDTIDTLQVNVGSLCNLSCAHCHVGAGPHRTETMKRDCFEAILSVVESRGIRTLDITGGAPEMNPHFEWFIAKAASKGVHVMVRSNLVILLAPKYQHLINRYAELGVEIVASLPNIHASQVERQRGDATFSSSIKVLKLLNEKGYGRTNSLKLALVFNPQWPILPPNQEELEALYRKRLKEAFDIDFNTLYAIANSPIGRYGAYLQQKGELKDYLVLLMDSFNENATEEIMCRSQISVAYDGRVYDCDYNQVLGLAQQHNNRDLSIYDYALNPALSLRRPIQFGGHCYACTAGQGSSCTGVLSQIESSHRFK